MAPAKDGTLGNRYVILAKIGSGGMGTVYRARDTRKGRIVAIKVLHDHLAEDPAYLERFRREAKIAQALDSRHIVQILDFGREGDSHYLVMEHVEGSSLREVLRQRGSLPLEDALSIAIQVTRALEEAHSKGVVHRDIKPENVMVLDDGSAKVADFGIARVQELSSLTITGSLVGTVQYMAPEALTGGADRRSDIYSLGIVLYQMLAGAPPFDAPTPWEVMRQHREDPPPSLREKALDLPEAVEDLLGRCLAKNPDERFQSAFELRCELERLLQEVVSGGDREEAAATPASGQARRISRLQPARLLRPIGASLATTLAGAARRLTMAVEEARAILAHLSGGRVRKIPPVLRFLIGGGAVLAVGLACYGIYAAATSDGGGLFPPSVTTTPSPEPTPAPTVQAVRAEGDWYLDPGSGVKLRATFDIGPASQIKAVVRLPFRVRYEGEAPGCSGGWGSDNTSHQKALDHGELGIHLEGPNGQVSQLVYATGIAAADNAVLDCGSWYEGAWIFAPVGIYETALVRYPDFEAVEIALPGESSFGPSMSTYFVRDQDTLASIAEYFGLGALDILAANPRLSPDSVTAGRTLKVPVPQERAVSRELSYGALELEEEERSARAVEVAFIALGLDPTNGEAHFAMGIGLYQLGKPDESLEPLRRAVELRPRVAVYHSWLAAVLLQTGDAPAARLEVDEALRLQPDEPIALGLLRFLEGTPRATATRQPAPTRTATPTPMPTVTLPPQTETPTPVPTPEPCGPAFAGVSLGDELGGGAVILGVVAESAADSAGLLAGDVITTVDGQAVSDARAVGDAIDARCPGDTVVFTVRRVESMPVTVGDPAGTPTGLEVENEPGGGGAVITGIYAESTAEASGLWVGDVIIAIEGVSVNTVQDLAYALAAKEPGETVVFTIRRVIKVSVTLGAQPGTPTAEPAGQ